MMTEKTTTIASDSYKVAYACKSWHGSLNPSDSYVPFIISYPGGNKLEVDVIIKNAEACGENYSNCIGNWKLKDVITEILKNIYPSE
jgi:hypothetical protein